jgi:hypothetical protein
MSSTLRLASALSALLLMPSPGFAQQTPGPDPVPALPSSPPVRESVAAAPAPTAEEAAKIAAKESWTKGRPLVIQYSRPQDKRGLNVFETTKDPGVEFKGFKLDFGAGFGA